LQPAIDYQQLGQRAFAAVTFTSNFLFWMEADYFDLASRQKRLLRTWSLSLEWQFYLIYPLILAAIWRFAPSRRAVLIALSVLSAVSFVASVLVTGPHPSAAFYLLPTRAWELLAGGLVALAPLRRASSSTRLALEGAGVALIAFAVLFFQRPYAAARMASARADRRRLARHPRSARAVDFDRESRRPMARRLRPVSLG
jgi:peptidoglycan/LPS O-acetylase OafA/YrhL